MASNEDEVPPLEDMSEALKQAASLKESKEQKEKKQQQPKTEGSKESASQDGVSEIYTRKKAVSDKTQTDSQNTDTDVKSSVKTKAAPKQSETKEKGFAGFSKGFLSGSKPVTRSSSKSSKKSTDTQEEIPYIEKKDDSESLKLSEVQETMNKTSENLMKNQEWVTDDLLGKVGENESVMKGFQNQEYVKIIKEFQANPQDAMEKYKDHTKFQEFFREFCKLMGDHFGALGSKESGEQPGT